MGGGGADPMLMIRIGWITSNISTGGGGASAGLAAGLGTEPRAVSTGTGGDGGITGSAGRSGAGGGVGGAAGCSSTISSGGAVFCGTASSGIFTVRRDRRRGAPDPSAPPEGESVRGGGGGERKRWISGGPSLGSSCGEEGRRSVSAASSSSISGTRGGAPGVDGRGTLRAGRAPSPCAAAWLTRGSPSIGGGASTPALGPAAGWSTPSLGSLIACSPRPAAHP